MVKPIVPGSFSLMKKINTSLILNTIREKGYVSRSQVAKITGLTPATVTNITAQLIKAKLILEAETGKSTGGRKPIMLRINVNGYYVIGIYIGSKSVEFIVSNLNSDIIYYNEIKIDASIPSNVVLTTINNHIKIWIDKNKGKNILGIGVGVHGLVNSNEGICIYGPNLGWEDVPVKKTLEKELNIPVFMDNDVRIMTLGEKWFGMAKDISNFIFLYIGYGIGGSIVIDNHIYRGTTDGAGEIGHSTIEMNGPKCSCGNYGCLQALASEEVMVNQIKELLSIGESSLVKDIIKGKLADVSPEIIFEAALKNDPLAIKVIKERSEYLGVGVANLINTFNPSLVIINGKLSLVGDIVMPCIKGQVNRRSMKYLRESTNIIFSSLGEKAVLKGTIALVLNEIFSDPESACF